MYFIETGAACLKLTEYRAKLEQNFNRDIENVEWMQLKDKRRQGLRGWFIRAGKLQNANENFQ